MNRRSFLRWLMLGGAVLVGGGAAVARWLGGGPEQAAEPPAVQPPAQPAPEPEATPPRDTTTPLASLFLLSDAHVNQDTRAETNKLKVALRQIESFETPVDAVVFGGDFTDYARDGDYRVFADALQGFKLPVYGNMGNHDYYDIWIDRAGAFNREAMPNGKTDAGSRAKFLRQFGVEKVYSDVWINDVHLILLSQEAYVQEKPEVQEGAWYSDEQLEWLKAKLAEHRDGQAALVFIHQGLPAAGSDGGNHSLIRAKAFRDILRPYPNAFVFSGHGHRDYAFTEDHYIQETFHWFVNSSVGRVLNRKYQQEFPDRSQGLFVQVFADRVELRGREFSDSSWIEGAKWTVPLISAKV